MCFGAFSTKGLLLGQCMKIFISLVVFLLLSLHALPYIIRDQVVIWLQKQGAKTVSFEALDVRWLNGSIEVQSLKAKGGDTPPLDIGRFKVAIDYPSLLDKRVLIKALEVDQVKSGLHQQGDDLWLGPINLSKLQTNEESPPKTSEPTDWRVGIENVQLQQIQWSLNLPQQQQSWVIDNARLNRLAQWNENESTQITLEGVLNGSRVELNTEVTPLPEQKRSVLHLKLDQFPLASVLKYSIPQLQGRLTADLKVELDLTGLDGSVKHKGTVQLDGFGWKDEGVIVSDQQVNWSGEGGLLLVQGAPQSIDIEGKITSQSLSLELKEQLSALIGGLNWAGKLNLGFKEAQLISIEGPQRLDVQGLDVNQSGMTIKADSVSQKGPLAIAFAQGAPAELKTTVDLGVSKLLFSQPDLQLNSENLMVSAPLTLAWQGGVLSSISSQAGVELTKLAVEQQNIAIALESATLSGVLNKMKPDQPQVQAINADLKGLNVATQLHPLQVLALDNGILKNLNYRQEQITLDQANFAGIVVNQPTGEKPMTAIDKLSVSGLSLKELNQLKVNAIKLSGSETMLTVSKQQSLLEIERLMSALSAGETQVTPESAKSSVNAKPFVTSIGKFEMTGKNGISVTDQSVKPTFKSALDITNLMIANVDTAASKLSPFSVKATINKHAQLGAEGQINLFGGTKNGDWSLSLKNAELPVVSPYSGKFIGYYLQSGQMDFTSKGVLKKGVLSGENHIVLNRLEVQPANSKETANFNKTLSMPLGTAIAVLQDTDGNIVLDVPVEGSLDDPKFGYQSVINRLASKGLKKAAFGFLTKALQPYGALISIASSAISANESGAFINLAPVAFAAGSDQMLPEAEGYVGKIVEMMNARKGLRLNICGNAVMDDRLVLLPTLEKANNESDKPLPPAELEVKVAEQLQKLAADRGEQVLSLLLQRGLIKDRLFTCFPVPDLENKELKPGVMLGL